MKKKSWINNFHFKDDGDDDGSDGGMTEAEEDEEDDEQQMWEFFYFKIFMLWFFQIWRRRLRLMQKLAYSVEYHLFIIFIWIFFFIIFRSKGWWLDRSGRNGYGW